MKRCRPDNERYEQQGKSDRGGNQRRGPMSKPTRHNDCAHDGEQADN